MPTNWNKTSSFTNKIVLELKYINKWEKKNAQIHYFELSIVQYRKTRLHCNSVSNQKKANLLQF